MGKKSAKKALALQGALQIDEGIRRQEEQFAREQASANIKFGMGSMPLGGSAPQIGGGASVAGGGGAGAGFLSGEDIGLTFEKKGKTKALRDKRLSGKAQLTTKGVDEGSIFRRREVSTAAKMAAGHSGKQDLKLGALGAGGFELDPKKLAEQALGSKAGQMHNRMMIEADQFLNREGELYDQAVRAQVGPIMEGAAQGLDRAMDNIKQGFARGGGARNNAMKAMVEMQAQIETNAKVSSQLSDAHFKLDVWARDNAKSTIQAAESWADNVAGIRQSYAAGMQATSNYMGQIAMPGLADATNARQALRMEDTKTNWGQVGIGAAMAIGGVIAAGPTGGASLAVTGAGVGMASGGA